MLFSLSAQKKFCLIREEVKIFLQWQLTTTHQFIHIRLYSVLLSILTFCLQYVNLISYWEYNKIEHQM